MSVGIRLLSLLLPCPYTHLFFLLPFKEFWLAWMLGLRDSSWCSYGLGKGRGAWVVCCLIRWQVVCKPKVREFKVVIWFWSWNEWNFGLKGALRLDSGNKGWVGTWRVSSLSLNIEKNVTYKKRAQIGSSFGGDSLRKKSCWQFVMKSKCVEK